MTSETVTGARRDLGILLARHREAAGFTQSSLARHIGYSRSTVANAEVGQGAARHFWEKVDQVVGAGGQLLATFEQIEVRRAAARPAQPLSQSGYGDQLLSSTLESTIEDHAGARLTSVIDDGLKLDILDAYQRRAQRKQPPSTRTSSRISRITWWTTGSTRRSPLGAGCGHRTEDIRCVMRA